MPQSDATVARASVRVLPDTSEFAKRLKADLEAIEHRLEAKIPAVLNFDDRGVAEKVREATARAQKAAQTINVEENLDDNALAEKVRASTEEAQLAAKDIRVSIKYDQRQIQRFTTNIRNDMEAAGQEANRSFNKGFRGRGGGGLFGGDLGETALKVAIASAIAFAPQVLSLANSLSKVVGVLALIPSLALGGGAALATLVIGLHGFVQAIGFLAAGKTDKFNEALDHMSPAARKTALAFKQLLPQFRALRTAVQENLFHDMAGDVEKLGKTYLPILSHYLGAIATQLNLAGQDAIDFLESSQALHDTSRIFGNIQRAAVAMRPALRFVLQAFGDLAAVGSDSLPSIARNITDISRRFANWIRNARNTGQIARWIQDAATALHDLWTIGKGTIEIITGLMHAAGASGKNPLTTLAHAIDSVAKAVNSPGVQNGLRAFFAMMRTVQSQLGGGLKNLGKALLELAPAIASLAGGKAKTVGKLLTDIANAIHNLAPGFNQAAPVVSHAIDQIVDALGPLIPMIGDLLGSGLEDAVPLIEGIGNAFEVIAPAIRTIAGLFHQATQAKDEWYSSLQDLGSIGKFMKIFSQVTAGISAGLIPIAAGLGTKWGTEIGNKLRAAIIAWAPQVGHWFQSVNNMALTWVGQFVSVINSKLGSLLASAGARLGQLPGLARSGFTGMLNAGSSLMSRMVNSTANGIQRALSAVRRLSQSRSIASSAFGGVVSAIAGRMSDAVGRARDGVQRVINALRSITNAAFSAGASIMRAFGQGILSTLSDAYNAALHAVQAIKNLMPHSPAKEGPFSGKGWVLYSGRAISEGLAEGIRQRSSVARSAAEALMAGVAGPGVQAFGPAAAGAGASGHTFVIQGANKSPYEIARQTANEFDWMFGRGA